jgi:hypothetical protein
VEKKKPSRITKPVIPGKSDDVPPNSTEQLLSALKTAAGEVPVRIDRMMESLRYAEYDIEGGVGELIDNSVEGGAQNIWVFVEKEPKKFKNKSIDVVSAVAAVDDGVGMSADTLGRCLVLGESVRPRKPGGRRGIGRFGVGMTLGAISLGRRVEVYSREAGDAPFLYTYIDLGEISKRQQIVIPKPIAKEPPAQYAQLLKGSSGTVVLIRDCDRLQTDPVEKEKGIAASEQVKGLPTFIGRTYRKYIEAGRKMWLDGKPVFLHDPLYMMSPTRFDSEGKEELKAVSVGTETIPLELPNEPGKTAEVTIRMSLLPKEWRKERGAGGSPFAKDRKIHENEGISILRADREVLYHHVPYTTGEKGESTAQDIDRWWGCEISFPPELDDYFHVRYIKRGAEPVKSLRDQIKDKIGPVVKTLRAQIRRDFDEYEAAKVQTEGIFAQAEKDMATANAKLPRSLRGMEVSPDEEEEALERLVEEDLRTKSASPEDKQQKKEQLKEQEFAILPVSFPKQVFFETEHLLGRTVVKLNVAHPFYKEVFKPLCGSVETLTEDSDPNEGAKTEAEKAARRGFQLLLLSYAKAEAMLVGKGSDELLENLRSQWGISLATAMNTSNGKKG